MHQKPRAKLPSCQLLAGATIGAMHHPILCKFGLAMQDTPRAISMFNEQYQEINRLLSKSAVQIVFIVK